MKILTSVFFLIVSFAVLYAGDSDISAITSVPKVESVATAERTAALQSASLQPASVQQTQFREIWGYLENGEEKLVDPAWPVSDIGYFCAGISYKGKLVGVPDRKKLSKFAGRVHLVVADGSNQALMHFCLDPQYRIRDELIAAIATAADSYDGVQIDFETVSASDGESFLEFLSLLKNKLGSKTFSVAIPARTRNVGDAFDYAKISAIADRIVVMAYDEHWSGSAPGSIASLEWCRKVSAYARSIIPPSKLIMGLPFYGRAWATANPSKAYRFSGISRLIGEKNVSIINRVDEVPSFTYQETVTVNVFFEDASSLLCRARLYRESSVEAIAFWKIGQEDVGIWSGLSLSPAPAATGPAAQ
jgi:spore germination protein YaaH